MLESMFGMAASALPSTLLASFLFGLLGSTHCAGMCGTGMAAMLMRPTRKPLITNAAPTALQSEGLGADQLTQSIGRSANTIGTTAIAATAMATPLASTTPIAIRLATRSASSHRAHPVMFAALYWNLGRLFSYAVFGALAGALTATAASAWLVHDTMPIRALLFVAANLLVIGVGAQLTGYSLLSVMAQPISTLERLGQGMWRRLQPVLVGVRSASYPEQPHTQFGAGALWGWIPCGLVYTSLATAMSVAGSQTSSGGAHAALAGASIMLAFGLGTLPMMLTIAGAATHWQQLARLPWVRGVTGTALIVIGLFNLASLPQRAELDKILQLCVTGLGLH